MHYHYYSNLDEIILNKKLSYRKQIVRQHTHTHTHTLTTVNYSDGGCMPEEAYETLVAAASAGSINFHVG